MVKTSTSDTMRLVSKEDKDVTGPERSWLQTVMRGSKYILQLHPDTGWFAFNEQGQPVSNFDQYWKWKDLKQYFRP